MPLEIIWLGNAGFAFHYSDVRLMVDPYFTRAKAARLLFGRVSPDRGAIRAHKCGCNAVLVSHAHFDHCLDAPEMARINKARLYGTANTCALALACGLPGEQMEHIQAGQIFTLKDLRVRAIAARHPWIPGYTPGRLAEGLQPPLRLRDYRMDECLSFLLEGQPSVLVWSSTATEGACEADVLICRAVADAGWYSKLLRVVRPKIVIPSHWEDMFLPLSRPPVAFFSPPRLALPPTAKIDLARFASHVRHARPDCDVLLPARFRAYTLQNLPDESGLST